VGMKKSFVLCLTVILIMSVFFSLVQAKTVIRIGSAFQSAHISVQAAEKFKEIVESSGEDIEVQIFANGSLGNEDDLYDQVATGAIEMEAGASDILKAYAYKYYFTEIPYVMEGFDHFMNIWNSEMGTDARNMVLKNGHQEILGVIYRGMRHMTSNRPIYNTNDLAGLRLRLPPDPCWVTVWSGLGAKTVTVDLPELFTSLQTGVADASEGEAQQIFSFKLYEVQDYLILTSHKFAWGLLSINHKFLESLTPNQQKLIREAGRQSCEWATREAIDKEESLIETLKKKGMKVIIPDNEDFRTKAAPIIERLFKEEWPNVTQEEVESYAK